MREITVEEYLRSSVAKLGCQCIKFHPDSKAGMPDRLVLLPGERVVWVELKQDDGQLSELQKYQHSQLRKLGQRVEVLWNKADVDKFIVTLQHDAQKMKHR